MTNQLSSITETYWLEDALKAGHRSTSPPTGDVPRPAQTFEIFRGVTSMIFGVGSTGTGLRGPGHIVDASGIRIEASGGIRVAEVLSSPSLVRDDRIDHELSSIRSLTDLSVNDIARLCGIKRRQIYNLLEGGETDPHRAANIRRIAQSIEKWSGRFPRPSMFRSALLAPLDNAQRNFIDIASADESGAVTRAIARFEEFLDGLGTCKPVTRVTHSPVGSRSGAVGNLRAIYGDDDTAALTL